MAEADVAPSFRADPGRLFEESGLIGAGHPHVWTKDGKNGATSVVRPPSLDLARRTQVARFDLGATDKICDAQNLHAIALGLDKTQPTRCPLAGSARLGRGMQVDVSRARSLYEQAIELGHRAAAHNLGLFWEGLWGADDNGFIPDRTKAMQSYRRGGDDKVCQRRLEALR
ncbi:hypothetical protein AB4Y32_39970 [Paraburkholderia phymatum]|uniref:Uncharacterized protein n=1 Tax=Paraburkholderia phymatum TaxID=148447 RepID=A0ACC6UE60_9BURK